MLERSGSELTLSEQADLLSMSRSSLYYVPRAPSEWEVAVKHRIDTIYTDQPFYGSRRIRNTLLEEGFDIGRDAVRQYMREMGLEAIYPKPNLSKPAPEHLIYPYLLRGVKSAYPNHIWGIDITYIRLLHGWMYLVAILDWYSRYIVSWELSETLEIAFVLACVDRALQGAVPTIFNSDQGSHFTSPQCVDRVLKAGAKVSMDGRGRAMDNIFTERLWRTVKYEHVYLNDYASPREARQGIGRYLRFYCEDRPHQSLGYRRPIEVYRAGAACRIGK
jgi:putative transposase